MVELLPRPTALPTKQMDSQDVLVVAANNLRLGDNALEVGASRATSMGQRNDELPKSVIVTNVGLSVFDDEQTKVRASCRTSLPIEEPSHSPTPCLVAVQAVLLH